MKQRILSLFLAVLMVVSAVPMLLIPVVAVGARDSFTTSMEPVGENWPQLVTDNGTTYDIAFVGNWSAGVLTAGVYSEMNQVNENQYLTVNGSQWNDDGVFIFQKTGRGALLGASSLDWPGDEATGNLAGTGPGAYYSELNNYRNKSALAYTYTSPYEGLVDLSIIGIAMDNETNKEKPLDKENGEMYQAYFAVFLNDTMIWPVAGGDATDPANFELYPQAAMGEDGSDTIIDTIEADALKNVPVKCGDRIHFVAARYNARYTKFTPSVTFQKGYNIAPTTLTSTFGASSNNWPQSRPMNGAGRLTQNDAYWCLGNYDVTANAFVAYPTIRREGSETWAAAGADLCDIEKNNGVMIISNVAGTVGAYMFGSEETNMAPTYQYTAIATGKVDVSAMGVMLYDENYDPAANASATLVYYLNGAEIGRATVTTDANAEVSVGALPTDVDIVKGDALAIVALPGDGAIMLSAQPVVNYTGIESFIGEEVDGPYVLRMENESVIVGDKIGIRFAAFATRDVYQDSDEGLVLRVWDSSVEGEKTAENATANIKMTLKMDEGYAYVCEYDAIAPKQMTDTITIQAYATVDGVEKCTSVPKEVSLADVAYAQYLAAVEAEDEKTAKTMAAVLNYGAAAQKYFDYNVDDLANKNLPAEAQVIEKKEDGYYRASGMDTVDPFDDDKGNRSSSEITSVSLIFDSTLAIRVYVDVTADEVNCPITVRNGLTKDAMMDVRVGETIDGAKSFILTDIGLDDLSTTQYFQVLVKHEVEMMPGKFAQITYQGNIFTYSVEAYVARMAYDAEKPELGDLLHALMALSNCVVDA